MISAPSFYRNLGLAGGSIWMVAAGTGFASWSLLMIGSALAKSLLLLLGVAAVALIVIGVRLILAVRRLPHEQDIDRSRGRSIRRRFGLIVAAEGVGCTAVSMACASIHREGLIVPLTLVIVGLHFLPLASLFQVPRYNATGALFCLIPIATMLSISPSAHLGHALSWIAIPAIGCGLVALVTGAAGLDEVQRFLNGSGRPSAARPCPTVPPAASSHA